MAQASPQPNTNTSGDNATDDGDTELDADETLKRFKYLLQDLFRQGESYMGACRTLYSCLGDDKKFTDIHRDCDQGKIENIQRLLSDIRQSLENCCEEFDKLQQLCQNAEMKELLDSCERIVKELSQLSDNTYIYRGNMIGITVCSLIVGLVAAYFPPAAIALGTTYANVFGTAGVFAAIFSAFFTYRLHCNLTVQRRQLQETRESCGIGISSTRLDRVKMLIKKMERKMDYAGDLVDQLDKLIDANSPRIPPVIGRQIVKKLQELWGTLEVFSLKDFNEVMISGCEQGNLSSSNAEKKTK